MFLFLKPPRHTNNPHPPHLLQQPTSNNYLLSHDLREGCQRIRKLPTEIHSQVTYFDLKGLSKD